MQRPARHGAPESVVAVHTSGGPWGRAAQGETCWAARSVRFADTGGALGKLQEGGRAEWVAKAAARGGGAAALLAAAVSSDGRYLAVGGGDRKVHVWDARSRQYIQVCRSPRAAGSRLRCGLRSVMEARTRVGAPPHTCAARTQPIPLPFRSAGVKHLLRKELYLKLMNVGMRVRGHSLVGARG